MSNNHSTVQQNITKPIAADPFKVSFKAPKDWINDQGITFRHKPYKKYLRTDIQTLFATRGVKDPYLEDREVVARVFPFKVNEHLLDLIDWDHYHFDPLFQLTFPQPDMLLPSEIQRLKECLNKENHHEELAALISDIRNSKNPAPSNQRANRPVILDEDDDEVYECDGLQHKYKNTVLMFHKNAQTCHSYCTYCFRFNQFVGKDRFLEETSQRFHTYLSQHKEISDILITGGDPATMKADVFKDMLTPIT